MKLNMIRLMICVICLAIASCAEAGQKKPGGKVGSAVGKVGNAIGAGALRVAIEFLEADPTGCQPNEVTTIPYGTAGKVLDNFTSIRRCENRQERLERIDRQNNEAERSGKSEGAYCPRGSRVCDS